LPVPSFLCRSARFSVGFAFVQFAPFLKHLCPHCTIVTLDIFATSIDYDTKTAQAQEFFAAVQNKFHYAIHGRTAAELITERINSQSPAMGLTNWSGKVVTAKDAKIAKIISRKLN
jgi:hypothetical protein